MDEILEALLGVLLCDKMGYVILYNTPVLGNKTVKTSEREN